MGKIRLKIANYTSGEELDISKGEYYYNDINESDMLELIENYSSSDYVPAYFKMKDNESKKLERVEIPEGLTVIYGPSNTGKSVISSYIAESLDAELIQFHEPVCPSLISPQSMISKLERFINDDKGPKTIVIDSFRFFVYNSEARAAAMSGGISASLFTELTNLSLIAAYKHKRIIAVVNFLSQNDKNEGAISNAMIGATAGVIATRPGFVVSYCARTESNQRENKDYELPKSYIDKYFKNTDMSKGASESKEKVKENTLFESKKVDRESEIRLTLMKILKGEKNG